MAARKMSTARGLFFARAFDPANDMFWVDRAARQENEKRYTVYENERSPLLHETTQELEREQWRVGARTACAQKKAARTA